MKFVNWVLATCRDVSTVLREDGATSPISSRRVMALIFSVFSVVFMYQGMLLFAKMESLSWENIFIYLPACTCLLAAIIFSYFSSVKEITDAAKEIARAAKKEG